MRLTDADREALFAALSEHAARGSFDLDELERRVAAVGAAETREQAAAVFADLPGPGAGLSGGAPAGSAPAGAGSARPRWGRGHGDADHPRADWQPTAERFRDPRTGRVMRVWEDAAGGRHYVPDEG